MRAFCGLFVFILVSAQFVSSPAHAFGRKKKRTTTYTYPAPSPTPSPTPTPTPTPFPSPTFSVSPAPEPTPVATCTTLQSFNNQSTDASAAIQTCINKAPVLSAVELPPGLYQISKQIYVDKAITLRSAGRTEASPRCTESPSDCAILQASLTLKDPYGILSVSGNGAVIDHLVLDGNKDARKGGTVETGCLKGDNVPGMNMLLGCSNCRLTNSVSKNAMCGTAVQQSQPGARNIVVMKNLFYGNGTHNVINYWADGLTIADMKDSVVIDNEAGDNTDVDIVFGGCQNCRIQNNRVWHTDNYARSAYAGLMLQGWPAWTFPDGSKTAGTSGDYTGSDISGNAIDCGRFRCALGIEIGARTWYPNAPMSGGKIHDNTVKGAQQGLNVDVNTGLTQIYNNTVTNSGGSFNTPCGARQFTLYNISPGSLVDLAFDTTPASTYTSFAPIVSCVWNWGTTDPVPPGQVP